MSADTKLKLANMYADKEREITIKNTSYRNEYKLAIARQNYLRKFAPAQIDKIHKKQQQIIRTLLSYGYIQTNEEFYS